MFPVPPPFRMKPTRLDPTPNPLSLGPSLHQATSRDLARLAQQVDLFRLLSLYYTSIGFFLNQVAQTLTLTLTPTRNLPSALITSLPNP